MGYPPKTDTSSIVIPIVSIGAADYNTISISLQSGVQPLTKVHLHKPTNSNGTIIKGRLNSVGIVYLDQQDWSYSSSIRTAGIVLLVLPAVWFLIAVIFVVRKSCLARRDRIARTLYTRMIPLIPYHKPNNNVQQARIHNETCPICLEDFPEGLKVKVLPCYHGFHSECVDPWLNDRSDLCPICKTSILSYHVPSSCCCCYCCASHYISLRQRAENSHSNAGRSNNDNSNNINRHSISINNNVEMTLNNDNDIAGADTDRLIRNSDQSSYVPIQQTPDQ